MTLNINREIKKVEVTQEVKRLLIIWIAPKKMYPLSWITMSVKWLIMIIRKEIWRHWRMINTVITNMWSQRNMMQIQTKDVQGKNQWTERPRKTGKKIQERKIVSCCYQISMEKDGTYIIFQLREGWEES